MGRAFAPRESCETRSPDDNSTLLTLLQTDPFASQQITYKEFTLFNWGTTSPIEVNRALIEQIGVATVDWDDPTKTLLDKTKGPKDAPKTVLVPKVWTQSNLATNQLHLVKVKRVLPAPAARIEKLDRWFIPGDETCDFAYSLEGISQRADQVHFDVYAINHCKASVAADYAITFTTDDALASTPIFHKGLDFVERGSNQGNDWQGQSTATDGILKRRGDSRWINVACSPYTVLVRYFKNDADKDARLDLKPFWPVFDEDASGTETLRASPLIVKWEVTNCTRTFTNGQIIFFDKENEVYRRGLGPGEIAAGEYNWTDGAGIVKLDCMPYRAQVQLHTGMTEDNGVALAAMHTEVRLFCHPETGRRNGDKKKDHTENIWLDPQSLRFAMADYLPARLQPGKNTIPWFKMQLAKAGYHPGPINDAEDGNFRMAYKEFQRGFASKVDGGTFKRLALNAEFSDETKRALGQNIPKVAMFATAKDFATCDPREAGRLLNNPDAQAAAESGCANFDQLIIWANDNHYYTRADRVSEVDQNLYLGDYRGAMLQTGDGKSDLDAASISRPWIPLSVTPRLLSRTQDLSSTNPVPETENMRQAIGPLRVDWTFTEARENLKVFDTAFQLAKETDQTLTPQEFRTRVYVGRIVTSNTGGLYNGQPTTNCPSNLGGVRPNDLASYHEQIYGSGAQSLAPWKAASDRGAQAIRTIVHADVGQEEKLFFKDCIGWAGIYARPSIIGGDGYRFRAQVSFEDPGGSPLPNWKVLAARYPQSQAANKSNARLPQALSCRARVWRKGSVRAHLLWTPTSALTWNKALTAATAQFTAAFLHVEFSNIYNRKITDVLQDGDRDLYKRLATAPSNIDGYKQSAEAAFNPDYVWPFCHQPHFGIKGVPPPEWKATEYETRYLDGIWKETWWKFSKGVMALAVDRLEKATGRMRGHTIIQFRSSPKFQVQRYQCTYNSNHTCLLINEHAVEGKHKGKTCPMPSCGGPLDEALTATFTCPTCNATNHRTIPKGQTIYCDTVCGHALTRGTQTHFPGAKGKKGRVNVNVTCPQCHYTDVYAETEGVPLTYTCAQQCGVQLPPQSPTIETDNSSYLSLHALGEPLGSTWLWSHSRVDGENAVTWAHEFGHTRHLVHAAGVDAYEYSCVDYHLQHDAADNAHVTDTEAKDRQKQWDRHCTMTYQTGKRFFCGKCILKLRGWKVESLAVAGNVIGD